eukprot:COSAG02_NODE_5169_length_4575_cov_2.130920_1_plen_70_part_00
MLLLARGRAADGGGAGLLRIAPDHHGPAGLSRGAGGCEGGTNRRVALEQVQLRELVSPPRAPGSLDGWS